MKKSFNFKHIVLFAKDTIFRQLKNKTVFALLLLVPLMTIVLLLSFKYYVERNNNISFELEYTSIVSVLIFMILSTLTIRVLQSLVINEFARTKNKQMNLIIFSTKVKESSYVIGKAEGIFIICFIEMLLFSLALVFGSFGLLFNRLNFNFSNCLLLFLYLLLSVLFYLSLLITTTILDKEEKAAKFDIPFFVVISLFASFIPTIFESTPFVFCFIPFSSLSVFFDTLFSSIFSTSYIQVKIVLTSSIVNTIFSLFFFFLSIRLLKKKEYKF